MVRAQDISSPAINIDLFCDLLRQHADGSCDSDNGECAMLFGSTGVGKSTLLHLLAGAEFRMEAVEGHVDDFGVVDMLDQQLVTDMEIPGCDIGHSATSTTLHLNSHYDKKTGLTYIDTPGFNNVGADGDDTTVDAANSAAIMRTIRRCSTLRIVFLINVKDELDKKKAGEIRKLFELMDKFIKDAAERVSSVLVLFTHCDGYSKVGILKLLNRVGQSKILPNRLLAFLRHTITLLETHGGDLLVNPVAQDAQQRMDTVRNLFKHTMMPITDIMDALQCPLSQEVQTSLGLACASLENEIICTLQNNCVLTLAFRHLQDLRILCDALQLPSIKLIYKKALHEMIMHAETQSVLALEALKCQSFSQARGFLSIFNCDVGLLDEHMAFCGNKDALSKIKHDILTVINSTCDVFVADLDHALLRDDFCTVATVLTHCEGMLCHLHDYVLPQNKDRASREAIQKVNVRTLGNAEKAHGLIHINKFDDQLGVLLDVICRSSENEVLLRLVEKHSEIQCKAIKASYSKVSGLLNDALSDIADSLNSDFSRAHHMLVDEAIATSLAHIGAAEKHLGQQHLEQRSIYACTGCHASFTELKEQTLEQLRDA